MQKITILISGVLILFSSLVMIPIVLQAKGKMVSPSTILEHSEKHSQPINQDKNLIKGNWQREDSNIELHISELLKNGALQVNYLNSKFIFIEKAGWTDSSDVLRLFLVYRQDENPGYSLKLNYLAEKDVLIGGYVDGSDSKSYNVIFKRIK
jgi:hypothetical protein